MLSLISLSVMAAQGGFWAPKYLLYALALDFKGRDLEALLGIWKHFLNNLAGDKSTVYVGQPLAKDVNSCVKSILSSGKSYKRFLIPISPNCERCCIVSCMVSIYILLYSSHHNFNLPGTQDMFLQFSPQFSPFRRSNFTVSERSFSGSNFPIRP